MTSLRSGRQAELPRLRRHGVSKAVLLFLTNELETRRDVDPPCGREDVGRPERHSVVACAPCEAMHSSTKRLSMPGVKLTVALDDPSEVAGVEFEVAHQHRSRRRIPIRELEQRSAQHASCYP